MSSIYFTFDYNRTTKSFNYTKDNIPFQLESLDHVTINDWYTFYEEATNTIDRSQIRLNIYEQQMKAYTAKKKTYSGGMLPELEMNKYFQEFSTLQKETAEDWSQLAKFAELQFSQISVTVSKKVKKLTISSATGAKLVEEEKQKSIQDTVQTFFGCFGLEFTIYNQNYTKYKGNTIQLYFDEFRGDWNLKQAPIPKELELLQEKYAKENTTGSKEAEKETSISTTTSTSKEGRVPTKNWFELYDYAKGVKERADLREEENKKHDLNIRVIKNIAHGKVYESMSDEYINNEDPRKRVQALVEVKKQNVINTKKGWKVLQKKVISTWIGPYYSNILVIPMFRKPQIMVDSTNLSTTATIKTNSEITASASGGPASDEDYLYCVGITIHINPDKKLIQTMNGTNEKISVPPPPSAFPKMPALPAGNEQEEEEKELEALVEPSERGEDPVTIK